MEFVEGPIVACSTCLQSNAGLAVLRLSGFSNLSVLQKLFSISISKFSARKQLRTNILAKDGSVLDDVLATSFPAPYSFTGENVLELSVHGNIIHVERLIDLICEDFKFERARPGEFTYRAFKNKKLNLSQVEGLDLLLNADSTFVFDHGLSHLTGELHQQYLALHQAFKELIASVELAIDFSDDVGEKQSELLRKKHLEKVSKLLSNLYQRCSAPIGSLLEPSIVFLGAPNAGKSTLFNHLLGNERSIVSNIAGTTRDYLVESLSLDFGRARIIDTAGLRDTNDLIEAEGVKRSLFQSGHAFFRVLVINPFDEFLPKLEQLEQVDLIIMTHADCIGYDIAVSAISSSLPSVPVVLWGQDFDSSGPMGAILRSGSIGAKDVSDSMVGPMGAGFYIAEPTSIINSLTSIKYAFLTKDKPVLIHRQRELIKQISDKFIIFNELAKNEGDIAIIASELAILLNFSQELIGVFSPDDVLHHIFNNFCIGK